MACSLVCLRVLSVLLCILHISLAAQHEVGGSDGWKLGVNYTKWAVTQDFRVGDTLSFTYTRVHDVMELSRADYRNCTFSRPLASYQIASPIIVSLSRPGNYWFACSVANHCSEGMKLPIKVFIGSSPSPVESPQLSPGARPPSVAPAPRRSSGAPALSPSERGSSGAPALSPSERGLVPASSFAVSRFSVGWGITILICLIVLSS